MRVSSSAADAATNNGNGNGAGPDSPALAQLKAAIEPEGTGGAGNASGESATAVLESGDDGDQAGDQEQEQDDQQAAEGNPGDESDVASETMDAAPAIVQAAAEMTPPATKVTIEPTVVEPANRPQGAAPVPAPYDPIAECEEEIDETSQRIVAASVEISELDAKLKLMKKSWKTASDELVSLHLRRADLLLREREKLEREKAAAERAANKPATEATGEQVKASSDTASLTSPAVAGPVVVSESTQPASPTSPESTADHAARMAATFAPSPAADLPPTPEQERWEQALRSMTIEGMEEYGITPKIREILESNQIYTVGVWQDWPKKTGAEYTQMSGAGAKLTEARYEKVQGAMIGYMQQNPRPAATVVVEVEPDGKSENPAEEPRDYAPAPAEQQDALPSAPTTNPLDIDDI